MTDFSFGMELTDDELLLIVGGQPPNGSGITGSTYSTDGANSGNYSATSLNGYAYGDDRAWGSIGSQAGPNSGNAGGYYSTGGGNFQDY